MSKFVVGNLFLLLFMVLSSASQILVKELVDQAQQAQPFQLSLEWLRSFLTRPRLVRILIAVLMIGVGFLSWLICLTKLNLSYAYPIACTSVFLVTWFSIVFLNEVMTTRMWFGTALIVLGIALLIPPD